MLIWLGRIRRLAAFAVIPATLHAIFICGLFIASIPDSTRSDFAQFWLRFAIYTTVALIIISFPKWQACISILGVALGLSFFIY